MPWLGALLAVHEHEPLNPTVLSTVPSLRLRT
jgi:hypothetical protein